jgi:hypothetical protein
MSFRRRLLVLFLVAVILAILDVAFAPLLVAKGVRLWLQWAAKQEHLTVEIGNVEAPFLQPVVIRDLRVRSAPGAPPQVSLEVGQVVADLNFRSLIFSQRSTFLRSLQLDRFAGSVSFGAGKTSIGSGNWRLLSHFVPEGFRIDHGNFDLTTPDLVLRFRQAMVAASAIESGKFLAREITVQSSIVRQTFHDLRGATSWENSRLTIAGIPLVRGLDLETLTLDLSHLARKRVGIDTQVDAYGGVLRTSFQIKAGPKPVMDFAASASNVSLAQFASAVGFVEPISGSLRAAKFTFRGNPGLFLDGTASVWMELTNFSWREHQADNVMLGATYYDRRLEVDQLYIHQRENQVTINGELLGSRQGTSWMDLPFRGQINATVPDLNGFAQLFGATTGDFAGALIAEGEIESLAPEARGRLNVRGNGVSFRGVMLDSLGASLRLRGTEVNIERMEARHGQDFLRAEGDFDLHSPHRFAGRLTGAINALEAYKPLLPASWQNSKIGGGATFDWRGDGTFAASSGTLQFYGQQLQLPIAILRMPLNVTLEGSYSPRDLFFRTFQVGNDRLWLSGFLMLGTNFIDFQAMELALDGAARARGTLFLPFSVDHWRRSHSWRDALDLAQKFDVDLTVSQLDLRKLTNALGENIPLAGTLDLRLAAYGPLNSLQIASSGRVTNLGSDAPNDSIDLEAHYAEGRAEMRAKGTFGGSDPVMISFSLPLRLKKEQLLAGGVLDRSAPFSCNINCPALFLQDLPNDWLSSARGGLLTGAVSYANSLSRPSVSGSAQLVGAELKPSPPWPELRNLNATLRFENNIGVVEPLRGEINGRNLELTARLTSDFPGYRLTLEPMRGGLELENLPSSGANISSVRIMGGGSGGSEPSLKSAIVSGRFGSAVASLTIDTESAGTVSRQTTLFVRPRLMTGEPLLLRSIPAPATPSLGILTAPQNQSP